MLRKTIPLALCLLCLAANARAQFSAVPDPIQYTVAPEAPGPNQLVYIEAEGVGPFLGNATITWQVNGTTVSSGAGQTTFSFTTGGVGSATRVHVIINSSQGTYTHDFVFAPSVVDLVWEADTSAPLFYAGKTLYSAGSSLKVVAFPTVVSGRSVVPTNALSYQWSRGGNLVPDASGLGKSVFVFNGDEIQSAESVSVDVYLNGAKVGHSDITIPATDPKVIIYDYDPLRGELLDRALPNAFSLNAAEMTLEAEPYFFSNSSVRRGTLAYAWTLNDTSVTGPDASRGLLTLRQSGSGAGTATVGVSLQNTESDTFTQAAQAALTIVFGQQGSTPLSSFFGL